MKELFRAYRRPTDEEIDIAWQQGLIILDTNVLLNLYRFPKAASEALLHVLESVSSRLWIPYQVALEYQRNRLDVISEQRDRFTKVRKILADSVSNLQSEFDKLQLKKRHSVINSEQLIDKIRKTMLEFTRELDSLENMHPSVSSDDPLRTRLEVLFENKTGEPPQNQSELDNIFSEGKQRFERKIPPGYLDSHKAKKDDSSPLWYFHNGLEYRRDYGDLIVWTQIIKEAKAKEIEYVIFISDDAKEDWWWIVESQGSKTIGPRPELIEEIQSRTKVKIFLMYNSERFLEFANEFLKANIQLDTVNQVREITELETIGNEELEILDYMERFEEDMAETTHSLNVITDAITEMGSNVQSGADKISELNHAGQNVSPKQMKKIVSQVSSDMNTFVKKVEPELLGLKDKYESAIKSYIQAILLLDETRRKEQIPQFKPSLVNLISNIDTAQNGITVLHTAVANTPRITSEFNQAKRNTLSILSELLSTFDKLKSLTSSTIEHLDDFAGEEM